MNKIKFTKLELETMLRVINHHYENRKLIEAQQERTHQERIETERIGGLTVKLSIAIKEA